MPYTYTLAREARDPGLPLMRAMWLHYPDDEPRRGHRHSVPLGPRPARRPGLHARAPRPRRLPARRATGTTGGPANSAAGGQTIDRTVDLRTMPIYVRAGAIIPFDPVRQYTDEPVSEPTTLRVYRGADGEFTLYDDDGISQDYLRGQRHLDAARVERPHASGSPSSRRGRRERRTSRSGGSSASA